MPREHESNRLAWNEAALFYKKGLEEAIHLLRGGGHSLFAPELKYLSPLKSMGRMNCCIHLQCAAGTDTLSLINLGAHKVVGVDISEDMLTIAQQKSDALKMAARWIRSDILQVPSELDGSADLLYTGKGAINWIMDIQGWANVVARLLKPGGVFYLFEGHPFTYFFDIQAAELKLDSVHAGYFSGQIFESQNWPDSYVGKIKESESEQAKKYEKAWPTSSVITALLNAGLKLEAFEEHPDKYYEEFLHLPESLRTRIPNTYSLLASKPTAGQTY